MLTLKGSKIHLRAVEPEDLDFLYNLENNEFFWEVSNTTSPFSKFTLSNYIENSNKDIYESKQLRLIIVTNKENQPIGCIDLFDFEPKHRRVGVGIVISKLDERNKGYALNALQMIVKYAFNHLNLHQLYANISEDNSASIRLFKNSNFKLTGIKKDWIYSNKGYKNESIYQLINE